MLTPSIAMAVLYTTYLLKFPIMNCIFLNGSREMYSHLRPPKLQNADRMCYGDDFVLPLYQ